MLSTSRFVALAISLCLTLSILKAGPAVVQDFGQTALGSTSSQTVTIPATGSQNNGSQPTCTLHYAVDFSADACTTGPAGYTLTVRFAPRYPGLRQDAVIVKDSAGKVIAEAFLHGIGLGPQAAFDPGVINTLLYPANGGGDSYSPWGIVADTATGLVYVSERTGNVVFRIDPHTKNKSIYAGVNNPVFPGSNSGDGGPATSAEIAPGALALDAAGNLYISSLGLIRKVDSDTGIITTVAGGGSNPQGDGGLATNAQFNGVCGVAVDSHGSLYVCEEYARRIRKIDATTGIIQTVAGSSALQAPYGDGGLATGASLGQPLGITLDFTGNLYIADYGTSTVRKVDAQTSIITTVAGIPFHMSETTGAVNGQPATSVALYNPGALAVDAAGNVYIGDANYIRRVSAVTGLLDTIAGGSSPLVSVLAVTALDGYPANLQPVFGGYFGMDGAGNLFASNIEIERDKGALFFGPTAVGQTSNTQTLTIADGGNQPLLVSGFALDSNFSRQSSGSTDCSGSAAISPGWNCTLSLAFQPWTNGPITGALTVTDNSLNVAAAQQTVTLRGPWSAAVVSTTSVDFGSLFVGNQSDPTTAFINNPGDTAITISVAVAGVNASDFTLLNNTCSGITQQGRCSFWVMFGPRSTGSRTGTIVITKSTDGSVQRIALTGIGVTPPPPQLSISATSLSFDSPQWRFGGSQVITLTSTGQTPLLSQSIRLQSGVNSGFVLMTSGCPLGPSGVITQCYLIVWFVPREGIQHYQDAIIITDNAPNSPQTIPLSGSSVPVALRFVPVTPCRVADTRSANGPFGGPVLSGGLVRSFEIPASACGIPANAAAYSLNVTVVPNSGLGFLTVWPAGAPFPQVSTLNSDGRVKANAAIVPAGANGIINVYASDPTHVILDINGYFVPAGSASALDFFPLTPCRVVDTRVGTGPLAGPYLRAGLGRSFPLLSSSCHLPSNAQSYSLNVTAVPRTGLGFLTAWPTGGPLPAVSTLNAYTGQVTANAAVVAAGTAGAISLYATGDTDVVIDVNGYFAPPLAGGLSLYAVPPCRTLDTRNPPDTVPFQGTLPVTIAGGTCGMPATARAYVLNATVVPSGGLGHLTLWPDGQAQPLASTLNAVDGAVTSNMAIVPNTNGLIDAFATSPTHLIVDVTSYFAP